MRLLVSVVAAMMSSAVVASDCSLNTASKYCLAFKECRWNSCGYCSPPESAARQQADSLSAAASALLQQYSSPCATNQSFVDIIEPGWQVCEDNVPATNGSCPKLAVCPNRWPLQPVRPLLVNGLSGCPCALKLVFLVVAWVGGGRAFCGSVPFRAFSDTTLCLHRTRTLPL